MTEEQILEWLDKNNRGFTQKDFVLFKKFYKEATKDLEKENAELKDYRLTTLTKQQTDMSKYALNLEHKLSWYDDQLTKAKELLERYVPYRQITGSIAYKDLAEETEQFLSEVDK